MSVTLIVIGLQVASFEVEAWTVKIPLIEILLQDDKSSLLESAEVNLIFSKRSRHKNYLQLHCQLRMSQWNSWI